MDTALIDTVARQMASQMRLAHVADEVRGAVWEFFLTFPKQKTDAKNPQLRAWVGRTLQTKTQWAEMSENMVDDSGDSFSLIDLVEANETTAETLLIDRETPVEVAPQISMEEINRIALEGARKLKWREHLIFKMSADGMSCVQIAASLGIAVRSVYFYMTETRNRVRAPSFEDVVSGKTCLGSLTIKKLRL